MPPSSASSCPNTIALLPVIATDRYEASTVTENYFAALPPNSPIKSYGALVAAKTSAVQNTLEAEYAIADGMNSAEYKEPDAEPRQAPPRSGEQNGGIEYRRDPLPAPEDPGRATNADDQVERNGPLSNGTGFPAVTFQAGFSAPTATAPLGVPIGAELLGLDFSEDKLLSYAYAQEQAVRARKPPMSTPPLPREP